MTPSSFDPVNTLLQRRRTVAFFVLLGTGIAFAYALLAPKWYEATLTVVQSQRSQESAASALASRLPTGLDNVSSDVERIRAVFASNSVADEVIDKFSLMARYDAPYREQARRALWSHCGTSVNKKGGLVSLTCEDKDPTTAMQLAAYFGEVGNRVFRRVSASSAREERMFLEAQVVKVQHDVDESSRKLREFQEKNKIIDLPEQSKAVISAMAAIQGDLISKQLELSYLTRFSSQTEASVVQLQQQIAISQTKLAQLEAEQRIAPQKSTAAAQTSGATAGSADFFPSAMSVPSIRYELEQLLREQKIQETVFFLMTQRYEMAKVDEARDTSTFQILDQPTLPTYKSRPRRTKILMLGLFAGLLSGAALALLPAWMKQRRTPLEPT